MQTNERETEIIMKHVLKNEENLGVALDIINQKIRERIIKTFLGKLKGFICKGFICKKLDMSQWDWETGLCDKPYEANFLGFGVSRKFDVLNEPVYIQLQNQAKDLSNHIIGVCSAESNALMQHFSSKLDEKLGKGKANNWWIWFQPLKSPNWDYTDWNNKDTLIKMHFDSERTVKDIGNHLLRIIEVAKPMIEEWVEQNPPTP